MKGFVFTFLVLIVAVSAWPNPEKDGPPFDCPKNERYIKCELEECLKTCHDLISYPACPQLAPGCYEPACLCIGGYYRNSEGVCIPEYQCPRQKRALN